jgi:HEAT repeat protein
VLELHRAAGGVSRFGRAQVASLRQRTRPMRGKVRTPLNAPERLPQELAPPRPFFALGWKRLQRWALPPAALACLAFGGCASFWDDVTSRDFELRSLWAKPPDPLVVLRDSKDGDQRAKAFRTLREPAQNGGTPEEQEFIVKILCDAVQNERTAWCRQAAISSLRTFKDPRAAEALRQAYYKASAYPAATANIIQCEALEAMGEVGNPAIIDLLVTVVKEPPVEGAEQDKQQKLQERLAAARALGKFKQYQATEALVNVLKTEKDPGLRDAAHESLELATGKRFPPEGQVWEDFLLNTKDKSALYSDPSLADRLKDVIQNVGWWW